MAVYEIAGIRFQAEITDPYTRRQITPYRVEADSAPEVIVITEEKLAYERKLQPCATPGTWYSCALLRELSDRMLYHYQCFLVHAAALLYHGKAYLFVAPSGTGKTTHMMLWKKCLGEQAVILNGDKPFLRLENGTVTVYGSPWQGKEDYGMNSSAPLGGVFLLNRGTENAVRRASVPEALQGLLVATVFPADAAGRSQVLMLMDRLCSSVPVGVLYCNMEEAAVHTAKKFIDENEKQC